MIDGKKPLPSFFLINISWITCFFKYFRSFFILVDDPQALYVNAGCFKCISGMNLYPPNESFLIVSFSFYILKRTSPTTGMWLGDVFIGKLSNNQLTSCSLTNFDKSIILLLFVFASFGFWFLNFFLHFR